MDSEILFRDMKEILQNFAPFQVQILRLSEIKN